MVRILGDEVCTQFSHCVFKKAHIMVRVGANVQKPEV